MLVTYSYELLGPSNTISRVLRSTLCIRIAFFFFLLLQISRKVIECMYASRELGDIWSIQIPLHVISHPQA